MVQCGSRRQPGPQSTNAEVYDEIYGIPRGACTAPCSNLHDIRSKRVPGSQQTQQGIQIDSKSLIGSTVRDDNGKDIGKVSNLMIDSNDGKVAAVVISMGRTFGVGGTGVTVGGKDITVPCDGVKIARDQEKVVVTLHHRRPPRPTARGAPLGPLLL